MENLVQKSSYIKHKFLRNQARNSYSPYPFKITVFLSCTDTTWRAILNELAQNSTVQTQLHGSRKNKITRQCNNHWEMTQHTEWATSFIRTFFTDSNAVMNTHHSHVRKQQFQYITTAKGTNYQKKVRS